VNPKEAMDLDLLNIKSSVIGFSSIKMSSIGLSMNLDEGSGRKSLIKIFKTS
jgi:hypothetical protein